MTRLSLIALAAGLVAFSTLVGTAQNGNEQTDGAQTDQNVEAGADTRAPTNDDAAANGETDAANDRSANDRSANDDDAGTTRTTPAGSDGNGDLDTLFARIEPGDEVEVLVWTETVATNSEDARIFREANDRPQDRMTALRERVATNAVLMAQLHAKGFDEDNVLDVVANSDTEFTLYVDDRF